MKIHILQTKLISLICLISFSPAALAVGGVLEINHSCAIGLGCFSGDAAGYPVNINGLAGKSYRLTSDLVLPSGLATSVITIFGSSVSVDLNGFEITTAACRAIKGNCTPASGAGSGISASIAGRNGISISNGSITGMPDNGVRINSVHAKISNLRVRWNGLNGILVGSGASVSDSIAFENGEMGIITGSASTVRNNISRANGLSGISTNTTSTISGNTTRTNAAFGITAGNGSNLSNNTAHGNTLNGIAAGTGANVRSNTSRGNTNHGIFVGSGSTVTGNATYINGNVGISTNSGSRVSHNASNSNSVNGINVDIGGSAEGNAVTGNGNFGLFLSFSSYVGNVVTGNNGLGTGIDVSASATQLGNNLCGTNVICP